VNDKIKVKQKAASEITYISCSKSCRTIHTKPLRWWYWYTLVKK